MLGLTHAAASMSSSAHGPGAQRAAKQESKSSKHRRAGPWMRPGDQAPSLCIWQEVGHGGCPGPGVTSTVSWTFSTAVEQAAALGGPRRGCVEGFPHHACETGVLAEHHLKCVLESVQSLLQSPGLRVFWMHADPTVQASFMA